MKKLILLLIGFFTFVQLNAQNGVAISNTAGDTPDASAILDVKSTNQGVLIPRVDITDLATPAPMSTVVTSLLVYNTNTTTGPGFFYWDGAWVSATGAKELNDLSNAISDDFYSLYLGHLAGENATPFTSRNVGVGPFALRNATGKWNVAVGRTAGTNLTSGEENTFLGFVSGEKVTTGNNNTMVGSNSGYKFTTSNNNTFIGSHSGFNATGGSNILIGYAVETSAAAANNELNIGNAIYGTNIYPTSGEAHIGINTQSPDASSSLDITSTTSGLLIPRMTQTERDNISSPATGLLIFQTAGTKKGFYYNAGTSGTPTWQLIADDNGATPVSKIDDLSDAIAFSSNVFLGPYSGINAVTSTAVNNSALGKDALKALSSGQNNIAIGAGAMTSVTTGSNNILIGNWTQDLTSASATNELSIGQLIYGTGIYTTSGKIGIGNGNNAPAATLDVDGDVKVSTSVSIGTILHLTPLSTAPSSVSNGDVYVGTDNHIYCYLGSAWKQLD